jgi:Pyruvate/2-oxoacid:ferredoxin oxidoreductase gamma subunit
MTQPIAILIGALGGEGGGVLAEWLVDAATRGGYVAQATSIPGVAQRTGATTYYVEVFPEPRAALGERMPVLGLYPVPGHVDLVVASELLEAARVIQAGHVTPDCTLLIASTSRTLTTAEKMALGDGRVSSERLLDVARAQSRRLVTLDMDAIARSAGTVVSSVMLGAIAASGVLPLARSVFEEVVRAGGVGVESSLRGFEQAYTAALAKPEAPAASCAPPVSVSADGRREAMAFPEQVREIVALGYDRVVAFQDVRYGELFIERLRAVDRAERAHAARAPSDARVVRETARFLALWMAFDDIVRVASLKSARARFARVRGEIGAAPDDVVRIVDHLSPACPNSPASCRRRSHGGSSASTRDARRTGASRSRGLCICVRIPSTALLCCARSPDCAACGASARAMRTSSRRSSGGCMRSSSPARSTRRSVTRSRSAGVSSRATARRTRAARRICSTYSSTSSWVPRAGRRTSAQRPFALRARQRLPTRVARRSTPNSCGKARRHGRSSRSRFASSRAAPPRRVLGRPGGTRMKRPPTLAPLAAPRGAGQRLGAARRR